MVNDLNPGSGSSTIGDINFNAINGVPRIWLSADDGSGTTGQEFYGVQGPFYAVLTLNSDIYVVQQLL